MGDNYLARKIGGKKFTFHMNTALRGYGTKKNSMTKRNTLPLQCGLISYYEALQNISEEWARESMAKIDRFFNKEGSTPIWCNFEWALKNYFQTITIDGKKWNANFKWEYEESNDPMNPKFQIYITLYSITKPKIIKKPTSKAKTELNSEASQTSSAVGEKKEVSTPTGEKKEGSTPTGETYASKLKSGK